MRGTRVLVTGGTGFIGAHLVTALLSLGAEVTVFDRRTRAPQIPGAATFVEDLNNRGALKAALQGVDIVYHLAWSGVHQSSNQDVRAHVEMNLLPALGLFELCAEAKVGKVVFLSSGGAIYGRATRLPIPEDHPLHPISAYGCAKLAAESGLELFGHLHGLRYCILRPSVPYGERQNPNGTQGAVAVFLGKALSGEPITIWGDGSAIRDFFHVEDLVSACLCAARGDLPCGVFNIGGGCPVSLNELVTLVGRVSGRPPRVIYEAPRLFDPPSIVLDISRANSCLGWRPTVDLEDGVGRLWRWMTGVWAPETLPRASSSAHREETDGRHPASNDRVRGATEQIMRK
ncbi:MAG TPA: NAD-dependent epimerase/dehydratase family protein [Chthonomonadales bacterium]|nr:NAD-dependent epimerase/dehydratase family protein [Chthonomonadales bacterium]